MAAEERREVSYRYGQLVIGPPGSGKSTYCAGMKQFLTGLGRKVTVVNLDPANHVLPYPCDVNMAELITLDDVMTSLGLGPNGGLLYCMDFLHANIEWLHDKLQSVQDNYLVIDCPGQVELYTHNQSVKEITEMLTKWNIRLVVVNLVDSIHCSNPSTFISTLLTSLSAMLQLELPHVNVLSKIDLLATYGDLQYELDYYTEVQDLSYLLDHVTNDPLMVKYKKLTGALIGIVEDYSLVNYMTLNVEDKHSMMKLLEVIDKANGYFFSESTISSPPSAATSDTSSAEHPAVSDMKKS